MKKLVLLVLCGLLAAGCASNSDPYFGEEENVTDPLGMLRQRPALEEIIPRYQEMQQKLRDRLSAELGLATPWADAGNTGESACDGEVLSNISGAEERSLPTWLYHGNIPDAQWERAQQIMFEVGGEYGFKDPLVLLDRPSDHKVVTYDDFGAELTIGTAVNTILKVSTGCHLTQAAKNQG